MPTITIDILYIADIFMGVETGAEQPNSSPAQISLGQKKEISGWIDEREQKQRRGEHLRPKS
jgi:hypothetical protein